MWIWLFACLYKNEWIFVLQCESRCLFMCVKVCECLFWKREITKRPFKYKGASTFQCSQEYHKIPSEGLTHKISAHVYVSTSRRNKKINNEDKKNVGEIIWGRRRKRGNKAGNDIKKKQEGWMREDGWGKRKVQGIKHRQIRKKTKLKRDGV